MQKFAVRRFVGAVSGLAVTMGTIGTADAFISPEILRATESAVACSPLPENGFFYEFLGITLSADQEIAYGEIETELSKRVEAELGPVAVETGAGVTMQMKDGLGPEGDARGQEISDANDALAREGMPPEQQVKVLTERFGQFATFSLGESLVFTPGQLALRDKLTREAETKILAIFTPGQQATYLQNLRTRAGLLACELDPPIS